VTAREIIEAEDPKDFLRRLSAAGPRTKVELRHHIDHWLRQMPERTQQNLEAWYHRLDHEVMPRVMALLEDFYGVKVSDGVSWLFRTWVKNDQTVRRAAQIIAAFEEIIEKE